MSDILSHFTGVKKAADGWEARCPAHDDGRASLSINHGEKVEWVLNCHAGCDYNDIVTAAGLTEADLASTNATPKRKIVGTYPYTDEHGKVTYEVIRYEPKDFRQRRPDGNGGHVWNLKGVTPLVYQRDRLQGRESVAVPEGERDADRLWAEGLPATTNAGGAGKWKRAHAAQLVEAGVKRVLILPDNDGPGRAHAQIIAETCTAVGLTAKILDLPGLKDKQDVSDWLDAGHTVQELKELARKAPMWTATPPELRSEPSKIVILPNRTPLEIAALPTTTAEHIAPFITRGAITEIDGYAKKGKTSLVLYQMGCIAHGVECLGQPTRQSSVVHLTEERLPTFKAALQRAGLLSATNIHVVSRWDLPASVTWPQMVEGAVDLCAKTASSVLTVDTFAGWAKLSGESENSAADVLNALEPLQRAAASGLAVVILRHDRKGGGVVGESGRGSSAFTGAVDSVIALKRPEGASAPNRRLLEVISRFEDPNYYPPSLVIERTDSFHALSLGLKFEKNLYRALGAPAALEIQSAETAILVALKTATEPMATDELIKAVGGVTEATLRRGLTALVDRGDINRSGAGKRNDPHRFCLPPTGEVSFQTSNPRLKDEKKWEAADGDDAYHF